MAMSAVGTDGAGGRFHDPAAGARSAVRGVVVACLPRTEPIVMLEHSDPRYGRLSAKRAR